MEICESRRMQALKNDLAILRIVLGWMAIVAVLVPLTPFALAWRWVTGEPR